MSKTRKVNYKDFKADRLGFEGPEQKEIKVKEGEQPKGKYHDLLLTYRYDVMDSTGKFKMGETTESLCLEGPERVVCRDGVKITKKEYDGKPVETRSSQFVFDRTNEEHKRFLECVKTIYDFVVGIMVKFKGKLGIPHFSTQTAPGVLKHPILTKFDKVTGEPIVDSDPVIYTKVGSRYSPFIGLDKKTIPIEILIDTEAPTIPLFRFVKVFIGQLVRFQIWLSSATVLPGIKPLERKAAQNDTVDLYTQSNPNAIAELEEMLRQLKARRSETRPEIPTNENKETKSGGENPSNHDPLDSSTPLTTSNITIKGLPNLPSLPNLNFTSTSSIPLTTSLTTSLTPNTNGQV